VLAEVIFRFVAQLPHPVGLAWRDRGPMRLRQILLNLLSNACRLTKVGR
jgi:signal transduction histidine kinase